MRRPLLALALVLALPSTAQAGLPRSAIFFYPWYSNMRHDGFYAHWTQGGHTPPLDVASHFYPARGAYSSADPRILRQQMRDIHDAGVDEVVTSWWGRGSPEDKRLRAVMHVARKWRLKVGVHIEPYNGRTIDTVATDLAYLRGLGIRDVYVYRANDFPAEEWTRVTRQPSGLRLFAQTNRVRFAAAGGFLGFYTYDIVVYNGSKFDRLCNQARAYGILCAPSVGPGYDAWQATRDLHKKPRLNGATYDTMWKAALAASSDFVTITSYNEWSEGTQIEPAGHGARYESYDGAYGLHGRAAERAYIKRTAYWTAQLRR
jgi:glycoprotein endo-alpha-1,2-mannosidase